MWGLHAPLPATHDHHGVVLILAFFLWSELDGLYALFVDDEGSLRTSNVDRLKLEWRFNWNTHTWEDIDIDEVFDDIEGSDGGPEIPGDIPEPDGTDGSDPSDEGDGTPGGVVPG